MCFAFFVFLVSTWMGQVSRTSTKSSQYEHKNIDNKWDYFCDRKHCCETSCAYSRACLRTQSVVSSGQDYIDTSCKPHIKVTFRERFLSFFYFLYSEEKKHNFHIEVTHAVFRRAATASGAIYRGSRSLLRNIKQVLQGPQISSFEQSPRVLNGSLLLHPAQAGFCGQERDRAYKEWASKANS